MVFRMIRHIGLQFLKTVTVMKIWNSVLIRLSYFFSLLLKTYIHWGKPESLSVEPTNLCNLKCPECPSGNNKMKRSRLFLDELTYKNIINEVHKHLTYLQLYFQGEPFMHPKITDYIKYATNKHIYTTTSTNGHFLTTENCEKIVGSGLHQIIISVDGTTQQSFEKYRVGGSLDKVLSGIKTLQSIKASRNSKLPHIAIQFVVFSTNEHEINSIKKLCKDLNIADLRLKSAQIDNYQKGNSLMPKNDKYNRYKILKNGSYELKRKKNFKCFRVWSTPVISSNNKLLPCCFDKDGNYPFNSKGINNINANWKNKTAVDFRKLVWKNNQQFEMCRNCSEGLKRTWF